MKKFLGIVALLTVIAAEAFSYTASACTGTYAGYPCSQWNNHRAANPIAALREIMSVHMEQYESAPLFKADNATLSFYSAKDGKISVSYQGWDQSKTVLAGQTVCAELGASTPCGPNHRCPSAQVC